MIGRRLVMLALPGLAAGCAQDGGHTAQTAANVPFGLGEGTAQPSVPASGGRVGAFTPAAPREAQPAPAAVLPAPVGRGRGLMAARLAEGPELAMLLADDSGGIEQWIAPGPFVLALKHGRLLRSVNLPGGDLKAVVDETPDPLARGSTIGGEGRVYRRRLQVANAPAGGLVVEGRLVAEATEAVRVPGLDTTRMLRRVRETGRGLEGPVANWRFENLFWLDAASGRVLASRQTPLPAAPILTLNVIRGAGAVS